MVEEAEEVEVEHFQWVVVEDLHEGEEEVGHVHHVMEEEVVEHLDVKEGEEVLIF